MKELKGKQARYLRGLGHSLKPVLQIGKAGITDSLVKQLSSSLQTHELIKVKVGKSSPEDMKQAADLLTSRGDCQLAQSIGKILLLYKKREEDPKIMLPAD